MKPAPILALGILLTAMMPTLAHAQGFDAFGENMTLPPAPAAANAHLTPAAARTWTGLTQPLDMPFHDETPLEDVLKYVQAATQSPDQERGLQFYVDPVGLQEAERTMQSPITINLEGIPASITLKLALNQLDLAYRVQPEGFILITTRERLNEARDAQAEAIARELSSLRQEIATLREELSRLRPSTPSKPTETASPATTNTNRGGFQ